MSVPPKLSERRCPRCGGTVKIHNAECPIDKFARAATAKVLEEIRKSPLAQWPDGEDEEDDNAQR